MVAKKPAARRAASLKDQTKSGALQEFVLTDFRVVRLLAERFLPNEAAAKGIYQISTDIGPINAPGSGEPPVGMVNYTVKLAGFKKADTEASGDEKSFLVEIELEGKFNVYECPVCTPADIERMLPPIIQQLHVIAIDKMRGAVSDLGYHGVRPNLGARNVRTPVEKIDSDD